MRRVLTFILMAFLATGLCAEEAQQEVTMAKYKFAMALASAYTKSMPDDIRSVSIAGRNDRVHVILGFDSESHIPERAKTITYIVKCELEAIYGSYPEIFEDFKVKVTQQLVAQ
ncbi:MAG: hypothetical protein AAF578_10325 [Pseudomonadota bacterium]